MEPAAALGGGPVAYGRDTGRRWTRERIRALTGRRCSACGIPSAVCAACRTASDSPRRFRCTGPRSAIRPDLYHWSGIGSAVGAMSCSFVLHCRFILLPESNSGQCQI